MNSVCSNCIFSHMVQIKGNCTKITNDEITLFGHPEKFCKWNKAINQWKAKSFHPYPWRIYCSGMCKWHNIQWYYLHDDIMLPHQDVQDGIKAKRIQITRMFSVPHLLNLYAVHLIKWLLASLAHICRTNQAK